MLARRDYDLHDIDAGRSYIEAYVNFFKFAEGHEHDHQHAVREHAPSGHEHTAHGS